jgi:poly-gamma-glutamate capsule biosynthesis protein CapA/YwtB (metallophosphatase superfamily)
MKQGIEALGLAQPGAGGRRIAVLGRIADMGEQAGQIHAALAPVLLGAKVDRLFTVHDELQELRSQLPSGMLGPHAEDTKDLARRVLADVRPGDVVLTKGSHSGADFYKLPGYLRHGLPADGGEAQAVAVSRPTADAAIADKSVNLASRHNLDVCLIGDTYFGEFYQELRKTRGSRSYLATKGYDYALERFASFLQSADFVVANLEATLTNQESSPFIGTKEWILKGDPNKTLAALKSVNVGAAALGNNHTVDYGAAALDETLASVQSAGMLCFGAGRNATEAGAPLEINLTLAGGTQRLALFSAYQYAREFETDLKGYAGASQGGVACIDDAYYASINSWKADHPGGLAIAFPHWGKNYMWRSSEQRRIAGRMIDAGVDLIIGHGAHMLQEIERRRDRWIVYSLGNGYFGSEGEYARRNVPPYSLLARLNCSDRGGKLALSLRLYPIVSDNQKTRFQPRFATIREFRDVNTVLEMRNAALFGIAAGASRAG